MIGITIRNNVIKAGGLYEKKDRKFNFVCCHAR